jgi:hypothetical protein
MGISILAIAVLNHEGEGEIESPIKHGMEVVEPVDNKNWRGRGIR